MTTIEMIEMLRASDNERDHLVADELERQASANQSTVSELEYYINNPSGWDSYDESMSERIRRVVQTARSALSGAEGEA